MYGLLIQHARWQGELVTPDDTRLETGAKCDCVCIGCGEPLILRRGKKSGGTLPIVQKLHVVERLISTK